MNKLKSGALALLIGSSLSLSNPLLAGWVVDTERSQLNLVSTKKGNINEIFYIRGIKGSFTDNGIIELAIDLSSINTQVDIRNQRIKEHVFEVNKFASAKFTTALKSSALELVNTGGLLQTTLTGTLDLHGVKQELDIVVDIVSDGKSLLANTRQPVLIKGADFGFDNGFNKLSELMGGISISRSIPVSFSLVLTR
jgi:polyisoprenoid-binding protein YceI